MSSPRTQTWVWLLLPLLLARALMPVGFMAQMHEGKLQIVLCSAGFSQSVAIDDHPSGNDHRNNDHRANDHRAEQSDNSCPFAQAVAAPLLNLSGSEAIPYFDTEVFLPLIELPYYAAGPPRLHHVRGPPHA